MTRFRPRRFFPLFVLYFLFLWLAPSYLCGQGAPQDAATTLSVTAPPQTSGQTTPSDHFLRPLYPDDSREAGELWTTPMEDGCLRISPLRQWSRTGLALRKGQLLEIQAEGFVHGCQRPVDDWAYGPWGPEGGPYDRDPNIKLCALIGRLVGEKETREFIVGASFWWKVPFDGELMLGVSDIWHWDNSGEFVAAVQVDGKPVDFARHQAALKADLEKLQMEKARAGVFDISGMVIDKTPHFSQEMLDKIAAAQSDEDLERVFREKRGGGPVPNLVITLQGESVTSQTITDSEGRFRFASLPRGEYKVSAPDAMQRKELWMNVPLTVDRNVELGLRTDLISVSGRITDTQGQPVAGAKVTATYATLGEMGDEAAEPIQAESRPDGSYELAGIEPPDVYHTAGYLNGGDPLAAQCPFFLDVRVSADGFVQGNENVPRVPLVTGELADAARRFGKSLSAAAARFGEKEFRSGEKEWFREKEGVLLPSSRGNTITDVNIVLDQTEMNVP
ncbi:MAG: carboxypeptidase-like regulatory domain-containing protein [bacterium]